MFATPTDGYEEKKRVVKLDDDEEARLASVETVPGHSVTGGRPSKKPTAGGGHAITPSGGSFLIMDSGGENAPCPSSVIPPGERDGEASGVSNGVSSYPYPHPAAVAPRS